MAFVEDLSPKEITKFIPDYLTDDSVDPLVITALTPYLRDEGLSMYKVAGFIAGAIDHQSIVKGSIRNPNEPVPGSRLLRLRKSEFCSVYLRKTQTV